MYQICAKQNLALRGVCRSQYVLYCTRTHKRPSGMFDINQNTKSKTAVILHTVPSIVTPPHFRTLVFVFQHHDRVILQEVTGALLENARATTPDSAMKLIKASGSTKINSEAQAQPREREGAAAERPPPAEAGRPRERVTLGRFMLQSCLGSRETEVWGCNDAG